MRHSYSEMISGYEKSIAAFDKRRQEFSYAETGTMASVEYILREWVQNKSTLYTMMNENLILSRPIEFNMSQEQIRDLLMDTLDNSRFYLTFSTALQDYFQTNAIYSKCFWNIDRATPEERDILNYVNRACELVNLDTLIKGYVSDHASICSMKINGIECKIQPKAKVMRLLQRMAKALGIAEDFEEFRIAHSMVLNQKKLSGVLNLSIHPLDYATASDNNSNWNSCMSWDSNGCYRMGTIEMMNSPYVICAYLSSDTTFYYAGDIKWNSKKWRAWVIVDKDIIVVNNQYPYDNNDLTHACIDWVKKLSKENLDWDYGDIQDNLTQYDDFYLTTNLMYNDFDSECNHSACLGPNYNKEDYPNFNFSGPAICMHCGDLIDDYDSREDMTDGLICHNCKGHEACCQCGAYIAGSEINYYNDNTYCYSCYSDAFIRCEACGDVHPYENIVYLEFPINRSVVARALESEPKDSSIRRQYHSYYSEDGHVDPRRIGSFCSYSYSHLCKDCLEYYGIKKTDIIEQVYLQKYSNEDYINFSTWDSKGFCYSMILNPRTVSFETAAKIFGIPDSKKSIYHTAWENIEKELEEQSLI